MADRKREDLCLKTFIERASAITGEKTELVGRPEDDKALQRLVRP